MSAQFASASMNTNNTAPARGAVVNGVAVVNGAASRAWADGGGTAGAQLAAGALKPHAQAKLLSPTEKCKVICFNV